ncbi:unnamed protein product [Thelazia callipaeda]|uniref:RING-type domain-containing protein n=1 Tax=Thelazia callipaeda TaxID=103827 RepID=A0A0N5D4F7_THECL|nr:unnamed protein product [Thelazia callipaeda]
MERLEIEGVFGAVNAFAVDDAGQFAYLFDPRVDATIRIDLRNGTKNVLVWYDRSFRHRRWLCYCMFAIEQCQTTYLPTLFYNTKRKHFVLVTFVIDVDGKVLNTYAENVINTDCIELEKLAYNAHMDDNFIHIIFYERFTIHSSPTDDTKRSLSYLYYNYNCKSHNISNRKGLLPQGQWELPFVAHDVTVWCNAWRDGISWYVVSEKTSRTNGIMQKITLWQLDVLDCAWRLLPVFIETMASVRNFALRIENNNFAYLHIDWDREGIFYKFDLVELLSKRSDGAVARRKFEEKVKTESPTVSPAEIICPVCLDTYRDPRTLICGHTICFSCVQQMKNMGESNSIRCFACRRSTVIPASGLPVNFSLKDAIESLIKAKQIKLSGLRCTRCRLSCDDQQLWICLQCATDSDVELQSCEGIAHYEKKAKQYVFCAQCILKQHKKHRLIEYCAFRKRYISAEKTHEKFKKTVEEMLQILSPLRDLTLAELIKACDLLSRPDEMDINNEIESVLGTFQKRIKNIVDDLEICIKNVMQTCLRQKALTTADGPTEL